MDFRIPFTISSTNTAKKRSKFFQRLIKVKKKSKLKEHLEKSHIELTREEYMGIALRSLVNAFLISFILSSTALYFLKVSSFLTKSLALTFLFSSFVFFTQIVYPKVYANKKQREIEKNLLPALEDMSVQLSSGVPLFEILVNISNSDYGELSLEFKRLVRRINTGYPQIDAIDELGRNNPSLYFRKALWQISNGMKAGSDIKHVVKDTMKSLNEEQYIQIQNYGNKLNPLIMFYMLISVILPALAITFLTIISSIVNLPEKTSILMFIGLFVFVILIQIMFIGAIRTSKPSLL